MSLYFFCFGLGFLVGYLCKFVCDKFDEKNGKGVSFL